MKKEINISSKFILISEKEYREALEERKKTFPVKFLGIEYIKFTQPTTGNKHQCFLSYKGKFYESIRPLNESKLSLWETLMYSIKNQ